MSSSTELKLPTLEELLQAGVHFGHKTSAWNPKMKQYIYGERNGVHIIDLIATMEMLKKAVETIKAASEKGNVLIVGTKGQAASLVQEMAVQSGAFYINKRWPGGLFTNFKAIKKSIDNLISMEEELANGATDLVKKEQLLMQRDVERLNKIYSGIKFMDKLPILMVVIDSKVEKNAIREARNAGIPVVALLDTNCDPSIVTYPVPANDDSLRSISLFLNLFGSTISASPKSAALISLRKGYEEKLNKMKMDFNQEEERKRAIMEEERERLRILKGGQEVVAPKVVEVKAKEVEVKKPVKKTVKKVAEKKTVKKTAATKTTKKTTKKTK